MQSVQQGVGMTSGAVWYGTSTQKRGEGLGLGFTLGVLRVSAVVGRSGANTEEIAFQERGRKPGEGDRFLGLDALGRLLFGRHHGQRWMAQELVPQLVGVNVYFLSAGRLRRHPDVVRLRRGPPQTARTLQPGREGFAVQHEGPMVVLDRGAVQRLQRQRVRNGEAFKCFHTSAAGGGTQHELSHRPR